MPKLSYWIIGYGVLLLTCEAADALGITRAGLAGSTALCGWAGGLLMVAAGLAAAQGRRSVRMSGLYVGMFLPLALAGVLACRSEQLWRAASVSQSSMAPALSLGVLAALALIVMGMVAHLRPREGIASRGYAVSISSPARDRSTSQGQPPVQQSKE